MTENTVDAFSLPVLERLSSSLTLRRLADLPVVVVEHPEARAALTLQGAQLIAWQPAGEQPVLWLSGASAFHAGKAVRGGVPICWPWFGPVSSPSHGFARITTWTLDAHEETAEAVHLTLTLRSDDRTRELWPHDFTLTARFALGRKCEITLTAEGDHTSTAALHSYFRVGAAGQVSVSGLGDHYIDKVRDGAEGVQRGDLTFPGHVDRIYTRPQDVALVRDPVLGRTIGVRHHDASDAVAWNPGAKLSAEMADVPDDGHTGFVCVETARITRPLTTTENTPTTFGVTLSLDHP
ncbi:D-hexose-6-phosphate mutarotase [Actinomadura kijaniata]|uniref:D-hexose-6-phosphate mutarotase n=1 Tax=Actinomadura kijaniata TaxID=46161 RepID=UPI00083509F0|nr:D-hexose-6-phosphate mutarotase [Actinomadura kijaniata]